MLYVLPKHDLLTVGATPSRACMGYGATVVASRHLLSDAGSNAAAAADTAGEDAEDTAAAAGRRLAQAGAVTVPARFRVDLSIGKNYSKSLGEFKFNATVPAAITLNMLSNFTDVSAVLAGRKDVPKPHDAHVPQPAAWLLFE